MVCSAASRGDLFTYSISRRLRGLVPALGAGKEVCFLSFSRLVAARMWISKSSWVGGFNVLVGWYARRFRRADFVVLGGKKLALPSGRWQGIDGLTVHV